MRFQLLMLQFVVFVDVLFADDHFDDSRAIEKIELLAGKVTAEGNGRIKIALPNTNVLR